jgi:hypothetical protein
MMLHVYVTVHSLNKRMSYLGVMMCGILNNTLGSVKSGYLAISGGSGGSVCSTGSVSVEFMGFIVLVWCDSVKQLSKVVCKAVSES